MPGKVPIGTNVTFTKNTQFDTPNNAPITKKDELEHQKSIAEIILTPPRFSWYWSESEIEKLLDHPELTAGELRELFLPNRTEGSIRKKRHQLGRYRKGAVPTCKRCEERPVWTESAKAKAWGYCKGCYLDEMERRTAEDIRSARFRKREWEARKTEKKLNELQKAKRVHSAAEKAPRKQRA